MIIVLILLLLFLLYILSTVCRTGHKGLCELSDWSYAHRGLHGPDAPENSMAAFTKAKEAGYGIELDIHLLADGNLAVMHDASLLRTTGSEGYIEDLCADDLQKYHLEGTNETIPLFSDVLALYNGAAPLIVELKCVQNNYAQLCSAACKIMDQYEGSFCMESFDPRCIRWLRKNRPDVIRGQLTENYFASKSSKLPVVLKFILKNQMMNFLTLPDFVAYRFSDRRTLSNLLVRKLWKAQGVSWTLKTPAEYETAVQEKWVPIFENFRP